jgi:putative MFS transporter
MLRLGVIPAIIVLALRTTVPESPRWLIEKGHFRRATDFIASIVPTLKDQVDAIVTDAATRARNIKTRKMGYGQLLTNRYIRRTVLAVILWFCMDIATYGIGILTPTILAIITFDKVTNFILKDLVATKGAAYLDSFMIAWFLLNIWLVDKWGGSGSRFWASGV